MIDRDEFIEELGEIYRGSGYSMDSAIKFIKGEATHGGESSYDESAGLALFEGFSVFYSPCGYTVLEELL